MSKTLKMFAVPLSPQDSNPPNSDRIGKGVSQTCQGVFPFFHQLFKLFVVLNAPQWLLIHINECESEDSQGEKLQVLRQTGTDCVLMSTVASINHMIRSSFFWGFVPSFLILKLLVRLFFSGRAVADFFPPDGTTDCEPQPRSIYVCVYIFV